MVRQSVYLGNLSNEELKINKRVLTTFIHTEKIEKVMEVVSVPICYGYIGKMLYTSLSVITLQFPKGFGKSSGLFVTK